MPRQESRLSEEFAVINYPPQNWVAKSNCQFDVVIVGGGMAGLAAAFALRKMGIERLQIYDKGIHGYEGPWLTYAHMPTLRSGKELVGPALDVPALTFRAWYTAKYGLKGWQNLSKIPTELWMGYLRWYQEALHLPVQNERTLKSIVPQTNGLLLQIDEEAITTQKLVLATGRSGFGGVQIPAFIAELPKSAYGTCYEPINFADLRGKKLGIIGGGASGFDFAATALEEGVSSVEMILRRNQLPSINKNISNTYPGYVEGYYYLTDEKKWAFQMEASARGITPPVEALLRIAKQPNFKLYLGTTIEKGSWDGEKVHLTTSRDILTYDYLLLATGFETDGTKQAELASHMDKILLWRDREAGKDKQDPLRFLNSPYLGPHFQFLEKEASSAPYLKDIYCFNYAATMSHGQISGDIPGIGVGASRLARGVAIDLFTQNPEPYFQRLKKFQVHEFDAKDFPFLRH